MNMLATKPPEDSTLMKSIYFFDQRPGFQAVMSELKTLFLGVCEANPDATKDISINTGRIIAAALQAAQDADLRVLADLIAYDKIPGRSFKDKIKTDGAKFKTVHLPLMMTDYLKAGAATMNIHVLGPLEDRARANSSTNDVEFRITPRQYLHLAVLHLATLSEDHQLISLVSSNILYPFVIMGPKPKKPKIALVKTSRRKKDVA